MSLDKGRKSSIIIFKAAPAKIWIKEWCKSMKKEEDIIDDLPLADGQDINNNRNRIGINGCES